MGFARGLECLQSIAHFLDLFRDHLVLFGRNIGRCEQHAGGLPCAIYKQTKGKQCSAFEGCAHGAAWLGRPFFNKVNGGCFSIHQQEATPFEIFNYITAASRSKIGLGTSASNSASGSILRLLPSMSCPGDHYLAYS